MIRSVCISRWQMILTRVSPPSQKTIYNFKLVVGHPTKHMKHGRLCDIEIWLPSVENVTLGLHPRATFSTSGSSYFNVHSLPCIICIIIVTVLWTVTMLVHCRWQHGLLMSRVSLMTILSPVHRYHSPSVFQLVIIHCCIMIYCSMEMCDVCLKAYSYPA